MEFSETIKQSEKRLNKLRIITNFFDNADVVVISIRTKIIHDVFVANPTLDVTKLELFHLQYTDSFLQLMQQLKKNTEQKFLLIENEIKINSEFVKTYQSEIKQDSFKEDTVKCNQKLKLFFESAYDFLAYNNLSKASESLYLSHFANQYGPEYYRQLSTENFKDLDQQKIDVFHLYQDYFIEKKLLGKININRFQVKLLCGFQYNDFYFSIFEFVHVNEHFIYNHHKKQFQLLDLKSYTAFDFSKNNSNKQALIISLNKKIKNLDQQANNVLKHIPADVQQVIKEYYNKIAAISFLDNLQNVDEQTNILKTMLNLNIN